MWLRQSTGYLLKHRWQTILLTFLITFIPVIGAVGILIAAMVTLCKSVTEGAVLAVAATLPYLISFYLTGLPDQSSQLVVWAAVGVAVSSNLLTWVFAVMLRRHASWSSILQIAALTGVLIVSLVHLVYPGVTEWWGQQLQTYYTHTASMAGSLKLHATSGTADVQAEMINVTKEYASGLMVAGVMLNAVLQLIVARWWQAYLFNPGMLRKELHGIRLSHLAGVLFFVSLVFSYLGNRVVLDIMPILYVLFGAAGLSLIHYLFGLMTSSTVWFWLAVLYLTLIFTMPVSMVVVAFLAFLDIWLDVRKRFIKV